MQFPINIKHHPLLGFDLHSMTRDVRWGSGVLSFCYLSLCLCCLSSDVYLSPQRCLCAGRSCFMIQDHSANIFITIALSWPELISQRKHSTLLHRHQICQFQVRIPFIFVTWDAPLSKSVQCCPLVTTELHIGWRGHAPRLAGAGARNTVYTTHRV